MENGSTSRRTLKNGSIISESTITSMTSIGTNNKPLIIAQTFYIGKKLGSGNFGEVRYGKDIYSGKSVAIKFESQKCKIPQLYNEYKFYKRLENGDGIPQVYYFGPFTFYNTIVLELLGLNLECLFMKCGRRFSLKTVLMIAMQLIRRFEFIHSKGIIFRDVKPENFVIGNDYNNKNKIYILDFGLAKEYIDQESNQHIPYSENKGLSGTARYMSVNTHFGIEQSRRDDLESLGYMLIYLLRGALPWQGLKADNIYERYEKIKIVKKNTCISSLCSNLSDFWIKYLEYVKSLEFSQNPDYDFMYNIFYSAFIKHHYVMDFEFDWMNFQQLSNNSDQDYESFCSQNFQKNSNLNIDPFYAQNVDDSKNTDNLYNYGIINNSKHNTLPNQNNIIRTINRTETYYGNGLIQNDSSKFIKYIKPRTTLTSIGLNDNESSQIKRCETFRSHSRKPTPHFPTQKSKQSKVSKNDYDNLKNTGVVFRRLESIKFNLWSCCYKFKKIQNEPSDCNPLPSTLNHVSNDQT